MKNVEELAKAFSGLASHFKKAAEFHKAKAAAHDGLAKAHQAHHEFAKAKHEGMDDGDGDKAYFGKVAALHKAKADHHVALAALHKGHGEHLDTLGDGLGDDKAQKAAGAVTPVAAVVVTPADPATPAAGPEVGSVESMVRDTTTGLVKSALEMLKSDDTVQAEIRKMVLAGVQSALGDKMVPDSIHAILPSNPNMPRLVPRPGGAEIPTEGVDPQLRKFVEA